MFNSRQLELIEKSISHNLLKLKDNEHLEKELKEIVDLCNASTMFSISTSITPVQVTEVATSIQRTDDLYLQYVSLRGTGNIQEYEDIKKDIVGELIFLAKYRDIFSLEVDNAEDLVKKEIFAKISNDIMLREKISLAQAEKRTPVDNAYMMLKRDLFGLKTTIGTLKTRFDFYMKTISAITQTISVAGKELYNTNTTH